MPGDVYNHPTVSGGMMRSGTEFPVWAAIMTTLVLAASNATAHHSFTPHFDTTRRVNISGTVKSYEAKNPHSYLHIDAVDENGRTREYVCESHGVTQLTRIGIIPQLFKPGTK